MTLYFIEHKGSAKENDYLAVTNCPFDAERLAGELEGATGIMVKENV